MGLQATNAGIDFQQRVSAYMMMLMEFDMDISLALQLNNTTWHDIIRSRRKATFGSCIDY